MRPRHEQSVVGLEGLGGDLLPQLRERRFRGVQVAARRLAAQVELVRERQSQAEPVVLRHRGPRLREALLLLEGGDERGIGERERLVDARASLLDLLFRGLDRGVSNDCLIDRLAPRQALRGRLRRRGRVLGGDVRDGRCGREHGDRQDTNQRASERAPGNGEREGRCRSGERQTFEAEIIRRARIAAAEKPMSRVFTGPPDRRVVRRADVARAVTPIGGQEGRGREAARRPGGRWRRPRRRPRRSSNRPRRERRSREPWSGRTTPSGTRCIRGPAPSGTRSPRAGAGPRCRKSPGAPGGGRTRPSGTRGRRRTGAPGPWASGETGGASLDQGCQTPFYSPKGALPSGLRTMRP